MRKIVLFVVVALSTIIVEAQQLRDGHFFKTFNDGQPTTKGMYIHHGKKVVIK